ncbi:caffeoylshikimate esterase isoform X2 [Diospyros lotus]|uniref:caffeoylshikimate esterase isoform X2 n=1 Tax=Diospyros lotus TaxID=55363 RepID=UPI0022598EC8|nr:caffeoylshikimate esterase isoform X2 [Diospyros lotus]
MALKSPKLCRRDPLSGFRARVCCTMAGERALAGKPPMFRAAVTPELQEVLDAPMDEAPARRRAREAFKEVQLSIDHYLFKLACDGVKMRESYEVNCRGVEIFSKSWLPETTTLKAVVCFCHGYGDTCTFFFEGIARKLALSGYGVFAMDYPGFGLSEGLHGYIPSFDILVDDVIEHYSKIQVHGWSSNPEGPFETTKCMEWSHSCCTYVQDDMVPPQLVTKILIGVAKVLPKHKLVPQKDLAELAFRELKKREMAAFNVIAYKHKPRLRTAVQLLRTTQAIEHQLEEVSLPLLILHGEADTVTDPSVSKALYEKARSSDKEYKLYKDSYHCLLEGEPDDVIARVFEDIIFWLDQRSTNLAPTHP